MNLTERICFIYVHFKTPENLVESLRSLSHEISGVKAVVEVIVIDNSGDFEADASELLDITVITPDYNLGYAGAINLGMASSSGTKCFVLNPDVILLQGCVSALLQALNEYDIVAPSLYLDRKLLFRLPPVEKFEFASMFLLKLGRNTNLIIEGAYKFWRNHAERYWGKVSNFPAYELSGAILGFTRCSFDTVGQWDQRYFLYFEEIDWLKRAKDKGIKAAYIPGAEAIHLFSQSISKNSNAGSIYRASEIAFYRKHFSWLQNRILSMVGKLSQNRFKKLQGFSEYKTPDKPMILELSYSLECFPAARAYVENPAQFKNGLPTYIEEQLNTASYNLHWINQQGGTFSKGRFILNPDQKSFSQYKT